MRALLFSGGVDSTCLAWMERPECLVFIDYGQIPAKGELRACSAVAGEIGLPLQVIETDLRGIGSGTMAGRAPSHGARPEFWPFRNQMLITVAAMALAEQEPTEILIGTVLTDRQHSDGHPSFLTAMDRLLRNQSEIRLRAPAVEWTTNELLARSAPPSDLLHWTFSCHTGEWACGQCSGCLKREEVMEELGARRGAARLPRHRRRS